MKNFKKSWISSLVFALILSIGFALPAFAWTATWTGGGATGGYCDSMTLDTSLPPGTELWHFVLTDTRPGGSTLSLTIDGTNYSVTSPTQTGDTYQFYQSTPFTSLPGGQLTYAEATAVNDDTEVPSTLTVVDCRYNPLVTGTAWCSPGFWAKNQGRLAGSAYDPAPYLSDTVPGTSYTVGYALANPKVVKGTVFNLAADYLATKFGVLGGTHADGDTCPIDTHGNLKTG